MDNLNELIKTNVCISDVAKILKKDPRTVKKEILKRGIDISHFLGKAKFKNKNRNISNRLKNTLIIYNDLYDLCYTCGQEPYWNGKPMTLRMIHLDGNSQNNELNNLIIQCPNCFSQIQNKKILIFINTCQKCQKSIPNNLKKCKTCFYSNIKKEVLQKELIQIGFDGVQKKLGLTKEQVINFINN